MIRRDRPGPEVLAGREDRAVRPFAGDFFVVFALPDLPPRDVVERPEARDVEDDLPGAFPDAGRADLRGA